MNLAKSLLYALKDFGTEEIFGIPGDFALPLFKVIEESGILPCYTLSHEPAVGFAADASPRAMAAEAFRDTLREVIPSVADTIPDVELTSQMYLTVFPNFHPWGSFNEINYRFRPNGDNHEECIMEVMMMAPIPDDGDYTPTREIRELGIDDDFVEAAEELGGLGPVFNQDTLNMPFVHQGMKASARTHTRLAEYNETKIRHFHKLYDKWVDEAQ
ncbi:MAG: thiamine pyrophosphate-binding protein [Pseudomonadales bacterium]